MKKIWNKLNDMPIFFRLSFIIVFVLVVLIGFSFSNYINFSREKEASAVTAVKQANNQALGKIDDYLEDISNITKIPLTYKLADQSYMSQLNEFNNTGVSSLIFQKMNEQVFEEIMAYKPNIDSCFLFNQSGNGDYKVKNAIYSIMDPTEESWFEAAVDGFGKPVILDTYELPYVADGKGPLYVFGVARGIVRIESSAVVGVLLVNTQVSYFREITDHMNITDHHRIILSSGEHTVYDTEEENIGMRQLAEIRDLNWGELDEIEVITVDGEEMLVTSVISEYSGWRMTSLVPVRELLADLQATQRQILLVTTVLIIVTLLLLFGVSIRIVKPVKRLEAIMKLAEGGNFDIRVHVQGKDEIAALSGSFNAMITEIQNLVDEVYLEKINQTQFELQMLQAQINPHFLYNTLESISMMAVINDDEQASDMASNLGAILRYGISNYHQEVSLSDEIYNLKKYIALQEIRFKSIYSIKISIDQSLFSIRMIKMILQPVVENAVYHGMQNVRSGGEIIVSARVKDSDTLEFQVSDNGVGMTEQQVLTLNEYIQGENEQYKSIGLRNVNKRIKLRYGAAYGLTVTSQEQQGTTVYVTIHMEQPASRTERENG